MAAARATAHCPICLRDEPFDVVVVLVPCGHPFCEECLQGALDHHHGENVIDMRPLRHEVADTQHLELINEGGMVEQDQDSDYEPPAPQYGEAESDDEATEDYDADMVAEADTLPLPGAARAKALARPQALTPMRPLHPPPPSPVCFIVHCRYTRASCWDFGFMWMEQLVAWCYDTRHNEVCLMNPVTFTFITAGSFVSAPPCPPSHLSLWRDVNAAYNRRWVMIPR